MVAIKTSSTAISGFALAGVTQRSISSSNANHQWFQRDGTRVSNRIKHVH